MTRTKASMLLQGRKYAFADWLFKDVHTSLLNSSPSEAAAIKARVRAFVHENGLSSEWLAVQKKTLEVAVAKRFKIRCRSALSRWKHIKCRSRASAVSQLVAYKAEIKAYASITSADVIAFDLDKERVKALALIL